MSTLAFDFSSLLAPPLPELAAPLSAGHERKRLSLGDKGTAETIYEMQKLVAASKREDDTRSVLSKILHGQYSGLSDCPQKDYLCYAKNIYLFYRDHIKYVYDPHLVEYLERPKVLLRNKIGDCDSKVISMVATWEAAGLEGQFITIKSDPDRRDEYSHVYARVFVPKVGWIVADPTMPKKEFGWEPEFFFARKYWHGSTDSLNQPLDTQDSVKPGLFGFGMSGLACNCRSASKELSGLAAAVTRHRPVQRPSKQDRAKVHGKFQHGGAVHGLSGGGGGGWHRRRGGWGPGWGGWGPGWGWGGPLVVEVPVVVGTTDEISVVPQNDPYGFDPGDNLYDVGAVGSMAMRGMNGLEGAEDEATVSEILSGRYRERLQEMSAADRADASKADAVFAAIQKMPQGQRRAEAQAKYDLANNALIARMKNLAEAKIKYNSIVTEISRYTAGAYRPALAGLGVAPAVVVGILAVAAISVLVNQLIGLVGAWNGNKNASDGYLNQAANLAREAGVTITRTADAIVKTTTNLAAVAALGVIGYAIFANRTEIRKAIGGAFKRVKA